jgi:hypothetical protein
MNALTLPTHPRIVHPRTGEPVRAIALHPRTGVPVWPIMGGDGTEDDKNDKNDWSKVFGDKTPEQVKTEYDAAVAKAAAPPAGDDPWSKLFPDLTPDQVKEKLDNSRRWEDRAKDNKDKAGLAEVLLEALGVKPAEAKPEELRQQVTSSQAEAKATKVENAVLRRASVKGGDGPALTDSRTFMEIAGKLDPSADDFATKLDEAVEKFLTDNPRYKLGGTTGATTNGRPAPVKQQGQQSEPKATGGVAAGADLFTNTRTRKTAASAQ